MRLAKFLASCGLGARRKCEELILAGKVFVNGDLVDSPATNIDPSVDTVEVNGKTVQAQEKVYYLVNKPAGITSSVSDPHAERVITSLVPENPPVWPVGRLDKETTGLILLTNDGELTQNLTHPSHQKEKEYLVTTKRPLSEMETTMISSGVMLEDGFIKPDQFVVVGENSYKIVIHEGRNRIIRRMFENVGFPDIDLKRVRINSLSDDSLKEGEHRKLTNDEIKELLDA